MSTPAKGSHANRQVFGTELLHGRPAKTYKQNRTCEVESCDTRLSVYNPGQVCALHTLGY